MTFVFVLGRTSWHFVVATCFRCESETVGGGRRRCFRPETSCKHEMREIRAKTTHARESFVENSSGNQKRPNFLLLRVTSCSGAVRHSLGAKFTRAQRALDAGRDFCRTFCSGRLLAQWRCAPLTAPRGSRAACAGGGATTFFKQHPKNYEHRATFTRPGVFSRARRWRNEIPTRNTRATSKADTPTFFCKSRVQSTQNR